jgi:hypothetical protein
MTEIRNGAYTLVITSDALSASGTVYQDGVELGHFWEDKYPGYAVFRSGNSNPIARPKTVRGCVLKLTHGQWDGRPQD